MDPIYLHAPHHQDETQQHSMSTLYNWRLAIHQSVSSVLGEGDEG